MKETTLRVRCRFPTNSANRVRVVVDGQTAGELDCNLRVNPGEHQVRVTSWGLPLCGPIRVHCPAGASVQLALQVCLSGFVLGLFVFLAAMLVLSRLAILLKQHLPGAELLVVPAAVLTAIAICLLDFYVLLPFFSFYTFKLVEYEEN